MAENTSKLTVIVDRGGKIAAAAFSQDHAPAETGQLLRELDVPSGFRELPLDQLYARVQGMLEPTIGPDTPLPLKIIEGPVVFPPLEVPAGFADQPEPLIFHPLLEDKRSETFTVGRPPEGCMTCVASTPDAENPKVVGDLKDRQDKQPRVNPTCDGSTRPRMVVSYFWRNKVGAAFTGENYTKQPDDASVEAVVRNFDALVKFIQSVIGQITTLPGDISTKGLGEIDKIIRDLLKRLSEVLGGKPDVDRLLGDLVFEFDVPKGATIGIRHSHDLEMYAKDSARCSFVAKLDIDAKEHDELSFSFFARTDNPPKKDGKPVTGVDANGVSGLERGPQSVEGKADLEAGLHVLRVRMDLQAGNLGIADEKVKKAITDAVNSATKAVGEMLNLVTTALNAMLNGKPIPDNIEKQIKDTAGDVLKAAIDALRALVAALNALILESRSFVKLYGSTLQLTCAVQT